MVSPTRWTWVWVNSGSWRWTGRSGVLRFIGSQRVGHDWVTELTDYMIQSLHVYCILHTLYSTKVSIQSSCAKTLHRSMLVCYTGIITNSASVKSQTCPSLGGELYGHPNCHSIPMRDILRRTESFLPEYISIPKLTLLGFFDITWGKVHIYMCLTNNTQFFNVF